MNLEKDPKEIARGKKKENDFSFFEFIYHMEIKRELQGFPREVERDSKRISQGIDGMRFPRESNEVFLKIFAFLQKWRVLLKPGDSKQLAEEHSRKIKAWLEDFWSMTKNMEIEGVVNLWLWPFLLYLNLLSWRPKPCLFFFFLFCCNRPLCYFVSLIKAGFPP